MAGTPRSIEVKVNLEVSTEAIDKLTAAQERFNAALQELQASIRELQLATYTMVDSVGTPTTPAPAAPPAEPPAEPAP